MNIDCQLSPTGSHADAGYTLITGNPSDRLHVPEKPKSSTQLFIESDILQTSVAFVIVANAAVIGFETDYPDRPEWEVVEDVFLLVFAVELLLRLYVYRLEFFTMPDHRAWNLFDAVIVVTGVVGDVIEEDEREMAVHHRQKSHSGEIAMLLRIFRLLRILRIFRLFRMFKQLYMLASGFIEATAAIFWVSVLCGLGLYVCAIMLTRLVGHAALETLAADPEGHHPNAEFMVLHFGNVERSMFTLFELMAHPNMEEYSVVIAIDPYMKGFFIIFIIFGSFAMLSLLTGVISETMIEKSQMQNEELKWAAEQEKMRFLEDLRRIFLEADANGDGELSFQEFQDCKTKISEALDLQGSEVDNDLDKVFEVIDFDGSGSVDVDEFLDGMVRAKSDLRMMNVLQLQYMVKKTQGELEARIVSIQTEIRQKLNSIEGGLAFLHNYIVRTRPTQAPPNVALGDELRGKADENLYVKPINGVIGAHWPGASA